MRDFTRGFISYGCISSLWQDLYYGSAEKFSEYVLNNWIDRRISIPVAIVLLIFIMIPKKKEKSDYDDYWDKMKEDDRKELGQDNLPF